MLTDSDRQLIDATAAFAAAAAKRIAPHIQRTELARSELFSELLSANVYFKRENFQETGSFKVRGATNRLMTLSADELSNGCVVASSGNHGAAVSCAMQKLGASGVVFVPEQTSIVKIRKIEAYGGTVRLFGVDGLDTEQHAREYAEQKGMFYLSPYNDEQVIAGQGTCGVEIAEQLPGIDAVFIAVGGGGLIGGVGSVMKKHNPDVRVVGCQPTASAVMAHSIEAGRILDIPSKPTISDGTAGGIEEGTITFPLNRAVVDQFVLVDEEEIADAMRRYVKAEGHSIEGAAGVALAALLAQRDAVAGCNVAVIICGGNISDEVMSRILG
jgi:threonine dehydratase